MEENRQYSLHDALDYLFARLLERGRGRFALLSQQHHVRQLAGGGCQVHLRFTLIGGCVLVSVHPLAIAFDDVLLVGVQIDGRYRTAGCRHLNIA